MTEKINNQIVEGTFYNIPKDLISINQSDLSSVLLEYRITNLSNKIIYVCNRQGAIFEIPPATLSATGDIVVTYSGIANINSNNQPNNHLITTIDGHENSLTKNIQESLLAHKNQRYVVEERINIYSYFNNRSGIYLRNSDLVIYIDKESFRSAKSVHHPFCTQRTINKLLTSVDLCPKSSLEVKLTLIDNTDTIGARYTVFHNNIIKLRPEKNITMKDGVHITGLVEIANDDENGLRTVEHYSFEEISNGKSPIKLFQTFDEANIEKKLEREREEKLRLEEVEKENAYKLKLIEHQKELEKLVSDKEKLKAEYELEKLKGDKELLNSKQSKEEKDLLIELEMEKLKLEIAREKAALESKVNQNKQNAETFKTIAIGLGALLTFSSIFK